MKRKPFQGKPTSVAARSDALLRSSSSGGGGEVDSLAAAALDESLDAVTTLAETLCYVVDESLREQPHRTPEEERHFWEMADAAPTCLWTSDVAGEARFLSRWWYDFTGQKKDEGLHSGWLDAVHPEDRQRLAALVRRGYLARETFSVEYRLRRADGEYRWVLALGRPRMNDAGEVVGFIGSLTDVHEARQTADLLEEKNAELRHMARLSSMGQMVAAMAHELSQPLNAISNYAGVCDMYVQMHRAHEPGLQDALHQLQRQVDRARDTLRRVREFAQKKEPERAACDLRTILADALALTEHDVRRYHISVAVEEPPDPLLLNVDAVQIQQVLVNLITNARDAMQDLPQSSCKLIARLRAENSRAIIEIEDRGPGIPGTVLRHLFEPFITTKDGGLGLGLHISRGIIEAHGGTIAAEPAAEGGTLVRVELPLS